jgi:hypothetical protein
VKLSIGDIVDRWTIAYLKFYRGGVDTSSEINEYVDYCKSYDQKLISNSFEALLKHNGDIWLLESDIRLGKEGELGLEEVGIRALQIRDYNKLRIDVKNKLNLHFNEGFIEKKVNHASQDKV